MVQGRIKTYLGAEVSTLNWNPDIREHRSFLAEPDLLHLKVPEFIGTEEAIRILSTNPSVEYAEKNAIRYPFAVYPNDEHFDKLWGLFNRGQTGGTIGADINASSAWNVFKGSSNKVVAIIDSGIDYNHTDLGQNIWINTDEVAGNGIDDDGNGYIDDVRGWDFYSNDNNPMDCMEHGTHVAGIIGAKGGNGAGVAGVNWNVKLMPLKVGGCSGGFPTSAIINAITYSTANGANLSSNSYGSLTYNQSEYNAILSAKNAGKLFVAAAGNKSAFPQLNNDITPVYPASYTLDNIIAVLSTDHNDGLPDYSHYGATSVDLGAPGGSGGTPANRNIYSTKPNHAYQYMAGTSQAAPHVAGVAALVWGCRPDLSWSQVKNAIMSSTDYKSSLSGKCVTQGRLNAYRALTIYPPLWLTAPSNLQGSSDCDSITLTWNDNSTNEQGFAIERKSGPYWYYLDEVGPNVTSYEDLWLPCGELFYYRVYAFNQNGNSLYTPQIGRKTTPCVYCGGGLVLGIIPDAAIVAQGTKVTYLYTIRNNGGLDLTSVRLIDDQFGAIAEGFSLRSGETKGFMKTMVLAESLANSVEATALLNYEGETHIIKRRAQVRVEVK
jgi:subtilisin family serine protease